MTRPTSARFAFLYLTTKCTSARTATSSVPTALGLTELLRMVAVARRAAPHCRTVRSAAELPSWASGSYRPFASTAPRTSPARSSRSTAALWSPWCAWQGVRQDREAHLVNCTLSICQRMVASLERTISQQQQCIEEQRQQMEQQQQRMEELFHLRYVNARLQARVGVEPKDLQRERQEERDYVTRMDTVAVQPGGAWMLINSKWLENWRKYAIELSTDDPPGPINNYCLVGRDFRPVHGLARVRDYRGMNQDVWHYFHERYGGGPAICRSEIDLYAPAKPLPPRAAY